MQKNKDSIHKNSIYRGGAPAISDYDSATEYFARFKLEHIDISLPVVSVVTVVKNQDPELSLTIASVKAQDYPNIEHLIINGGDSFSFESIDSLQVLTEADSGISDAFNKGVAGARGEIICILNAGDTYLDGSITKIVNSFKSDPEKKIICASAVFKEVNGDSYYRRSDHLKLGYYMSVLHASTFVAREVYQKIGLFNLNFLIAMDYDFLLRAKNEDIQFLTIDEVLVSVQPGGVSEREWAKRLEESCAARRINNCNSCYHYLYENMDFIFQGIYAALKKMNFSRLITVYRRYFSSLSYLENE